MTGQKLSADLIKALEGLSALTGSTYGEVALKAKQLLDVANMPPFEVRLRDLK